jgi:hypothetical protein
MLSEYRLSNTDKREEAQNSLLGHGYDARCGDTQRRDTLVVDHPTAYLGRVDELVHKVDPTARRL